MEKAQLNLPLFSSSINTLPFSSRLPQTSMLCTVTFSFTLVFFFLFRLTYCRNEILILCNWFVSLYTMLSHFPFIRHNCILLYGWWTHTKYICPLFFLFRSLFLPRRKSPCPNMINNDRVGRVKRYLNSKLFHLWICIFIFVSYFYQMTISHWIYLMYLILTITLVVLIYI